MKFNELQLDPAILKAIAEKGYTKASPIQEKAIPHGLAGRDILGCAQTGTGKTAAFALPVLQRFASSKHGKIIRTLILTPTRELASQINESFHEYGKYLPLTSAVIFGGVSQRPQETALKSGIDILVATPGRLNDLIKQRLVDLSKVEVFILDEADRMLDMGFLHDVKKIINCLPKQKQTMLFSATMPKEIRELTKTLLHEPAVVEVAPVSSTADKIEQTLYQVDKMNKRALLKDLLQNLDISNALVFTRTKSGANQVAKFLNANGINAGAIHGNKSQNARQIVLKEFKDGNLRVMVATDIAARGIDIQELSHVINYDIPNEPESYVHRIGRTGRAGNSGIAISFCDIDEVAYISAIERLIHKRIPLIKEHDYPMRVFTPTSKAKPNNRPKQARSTQKPKAKAPKKEQVGKVNERKKEAVVSQDMEQKQTKNDRKKDTVSKKAKPFTRSKPAAGAAQPAQKVHKPKRSKDDKNKQRAFGGRSQRNSTQARGSKSRQVKG